MGVLFLFLLSDFTSLFGASLGLFRGGFLDILLGCLRNGEVFRRISHFPDGSRWYHSVPAHLICKKKEFRGKFPGSSEPDFLLLSLFYDRFFWWAVFSGGGSLLQGLQFPVFQMVGRAFGS